MRRAGRSEHETSGKIWADLCVRAERRVSVAFREQGSGMGGEWRHVDEPWPLRPRVNGSSPFALPSSVQLASQRPYSGLIVARIIPTIR
jgi:hypothetical protein